MYSSCIDWLEFSCDFGDMNLTQFMELEQAAKLAKEWKEPLKLSLGPYTANVQRFGVSKESGAHYDCFFECEGLKIQLVTRYDSKVSPRCIVVFEGAQLLAHGLPKLLETWYIIAGRLAGGVVVNQKLSRVDLACDCIDECVSDLARCSVNGLMVTRAKYRKHEQSNSESFYIGKNPCQLRIYNKLGQLAAAWCPLTYELSRVNRWGGIVPQEVIRFEFQLNREKLKSLGLNSLDDLFSMRAKVVQNLMTDTYRCVAYPVEHDHYDRVPTHPQWLAIMESLCGRDLSEGRALSPAQRASIDVDHILLQGAACFVHAMMIVDKRHGIDSSVHEILQLAATKASNLIAYKKGGDAKYLEKIFAKLNPDAHSGSEDGRIQRAMSNLPEPSSEGDIEHEIYTRSKRLQAAMDRTSAARHD